MKRGYIKLTLGALAIFTLAATGCKRFLDINDNPNAPENAQVSLILPSAQAGISFVLGGQFQIYGNIWSQYWTQNFGASQYRAIDQYQPGASDFDWPWSNLYSSSLEDLEMILKEGRSEKNKQYAAIALIMKAYNYQMLTDAFGDVPLKEATKGDGNLNPKYDTQKEVYDSIFKYIDEAQALIDPESAYLPGADDLIFGGDMEQWDKFANTLKLRAYLRLLDVDKAKAEAGIKAVVAKKNFLEGDAAVKYSGSGDNQNPVYSEIVQLQFTSNLLASATCVDTMNKLQDPRVSVFYQPLAATGKVTPIVQGGFALITTGSYSTPSFVVGARYSNGKSAMAPVKFISGAESYFLQAEASARGYGGNDAASLYAQGISASFSSYDIAEGTYVADRVAAFPAAAADRIRDIITQKYFAMCGNQGFEAWTEWRRTGYPGFLIKSKASIYNDNSMPQRFLYPVSEVTNNGNYPGSKLLTDKVWWDTK